MTSNFDFLQTSHPTLTRPAKEAEALVSKSPRASCFQARFALETAVHWLYDNDRGLDLPYDRTLGALIHEQSFKDNMTPALFAKVRTIHKVGNMAAHDPRPLTERDSRRVIEELFHFLYWLARMYAADDQSPGPRSFDRSLIPDSRRQRDVTLEQIAKLESERDQSAEIARIQAERLAQTAAEAERLRAEVRALKRANAAQPDKHDYNEAQTRDYFIDTLLREAGWDLSQPDALEYEVQGMPQGKRSPTGRGFVDYVLWGDNGLPLGLVEAKSTKKDARKGQHQAHLYADCLEQMTGQRPVIFYSNGYQHYIWDDARYPPREVAGFYKKAELERLIHRRANAKRLSLMQTNAAISGRSYQLEAIRRITEGLTKKERRHLLVMATGTGKTRTAIALVDVLRRANWVKRVLFLADRKALLTQAKRAFTDHLPSATAIDITETKDGTDAIVVLSTYPTMIGYVNGKREGEARPFGPGHFDLIIVDEAHRSIYQKYTYLFEYFDGLLLGLTATPRDEVHRDTYKVFGLEQGVPTFAYELDDAVGDGYLVPARGLSAPFKFLQEGIKYSELSDAEQEEYEDKLTDEESGALPTHIQVAALNKWLFNKNTVDQALELLMEQGIQVNDGDRLGKTIVFCRNIKHAELVVERFDVAYPQYRGKFAAVVHSKKDYAQNLIDDFGGATKNPIIAVSVDMLDTGIDVPEVTNLVFFKPVRSRVKFNQMLGRGTRLCPDLLGPGQDKRDFLIFDLCSNFEFFQKEVEEADRKASASLMTRLVRWRLEVVRVMDRTGADGEDRQLRGELLDALHEHVSSMNHNNFLVRKYRSDVEEFSERSRWDGLNAEDQERVSETLAPLPNGLEPEGHQAKQFDVLCYRLMLAVLNKSRSFVRLRDKVRDLADALEHKANIPMVRTQIELITAIQGEVYWTDVTLPMIERVRRRLRDLVKFVDRQKQAVVYTDFEDSLPAEGASEMAPPIQQTGFSPWQYRKKAEAYVRSQEGHVTVAKVMRNQPLTPLDLQELERMMFEAGELGTREQFEEVYGAGTSLPLFVRKLVGLDRNAAKAAFGGYLESGPFSADQIRFVETIIDHLTQNGVMDPGLLYEAPFTDMHDLGLDGVFGEDDADNVFSIVRRFNDTVGAVFEKAG